MEEEDNRIRNEEIEEEQNLREYKINNYKLEKHHIIKSKTQFIHALTGIIVGKRLLNGSGHTLRVGFTGPNQRVAMIGLDSNPYLDIKDCENEALEELRILVAEKTIKT